VVAQHPAYYRSQEVTRKKIPLSAISN